MIELRHLWTLLALKECGSLAAAAKKRFVTQSALSHQIKELETRINSSVFIRKSKPLAFTEEGTRLLLLAEEILPKVQETENLLKQGSNLIQGPLRVGIECHSCFRWLMPAMEAFKHKYPEARLDLSSRYLFDSLSALENDDLDLVLTSDPVASHTIAYQHLFEFEVDLVVSKEHPLAKFDYVLPQQLAKQPIISYPVPLERLDLFRYFLEPAGVAPGPQKTSDLTNVLLQRLACNEGVAALPNWSMREAHGLSLKALKLGKDGLKRPLFGAYRRNAANSNMIEHWLTLVATEAVAQQAPH
ncbi:LysR family transcriptional regulator [Shewanella yunxiaonensis]|uniref:HTH-type transcriptional regulator MetR n=1 Tax=Shewanella yunxiaonensis TaxID=2829809 RepID=A0ABX7YYA4_9GAMM|nr:LysR family transcriptional regulator [Shewanella yunxiaonensis]QUN07662.1 LysR family transcriptional regulator [Shewanella yunxiaonensis]